MPDKIDIIALMENLELFENLSKTLQAENQRLVRENEAITQAFEKRFDALKNHTHIGLEAAKQILTQIDKDQTAHWQKKENIRLTVGILNTLQSHVRSKLAFPCPLDDDF